MTKDQGDEIEDEVRHQVEVKDLVQKVDSIVDLEEYDLVPFHRKVKVYGSVLLKSGLGWLHEDWEVVFSILNFLFERLLNRLEENEIEIGDAGQRDIVADNVDRLRLGCCARNANDLNQKLNKYF